MKILLIQTGFIGDLILSTPVITALKEIYPQSELSVLTTPVCYPLLKADSRLTEVLVFDKRKSERGVRGLFTMIRRLRARSYDIIFSLHKSHRTALLVALSGAKRRYGFREASLHFLYSKVSPRTDLAHDVLRNLAILRNVDADVDAHLHPMRLEYSSGAKQVAEKYYRQFEQSRVLGIAPGSVWQTKRWTEDGFRELVSIARSHGWGVALLGGPGDSNLAEEIRADTDGVVNLCGQLDIDQSVAFIDMLDVLVSNDSSPLHMASACNTPVVALFCATVPEFGYGPWMVPNRIVQVENLECRPCGRHGGNTCPTGTHACRKEITATAVMQAVDSLFEETSRGSALWK